MNSAVQQQQQQQQRTKDNQKIGVEVDYGRQKSVIHMT